MKVLCVVFVLQVFNVNVESVPELQNDPLYYDDYPEYEYPAEESEAEVNASVKLAENKNNGPSMSMGFAGGMAEVIDINMPGLGEEEATTYMPMDYPADYYDYQEPQPLPNRRRRRRRRRRRPGRRRQQNDANQIQPIPAEDEDANIIIKT